MVEIIQTIGKSEYFKRKYFNKKGNYYTPSIINKYELKKAHKTKYIYIYY